MEKYELTFEEIMDLINDARREGNLQLTTELRYKEIYDSIISETSNSLVTKDFDEMKCLHLYGKIIARRRSKNKGE